jgi:hypothetical protein
MKAMKSTITKLLAAVLPKADASACYPPDPEYLCISGTCTTGGVQYPYGYFYCYNNCAGEYFCELIGCCS